MSEEEPKSSSPGSKTFVKVLEGAALACGLIACFVDLAKAGRIPPGRFFNELSAASRHLDEGYGYTLWDGRPVPIQVWLPSSITIGLMVFLFGRLYAKALWRWIGILIVAGSALDGWWEVFK